MKRLQLFEFGDQQWCPKIIRRGITELLATISRVSHLYAPSADVINDLLKSTSEKQVVTLAAGSGGGILDIVPKFQSDTKVILTDLLPDEELAANLKRGHPRISYYPTAVDATRSPADLKGVRVMFGAFHHLPAEAAREVLRDAVHLRQPIAIFEATERSARGIVNPFLSPLLVLLLTPMTRPFRLSRLFFTYVIPVFPIVFFWDGLVSTLRTYSPDELLEMTSDLPQFDWQTITLRGPHKERTPTLIGRPR